MLNRAAQWRKVDSDLGGQDIGTDRMNLFVNFAPSGSWNFRLQSFTYFDKTFKNASGGTTAEFDGYTTVDALFGWNVGPVTQLTFGVVNIFDEQYLTYYSQAGNTRADRYTAGRGRSYNFRANFRF